jgi:hypothetical protein
MQHVETTSQGLGPIDRQGTGSSAYGSWACIPSAHRRIGAIGIHSLHARLLKRAIHLRLQSSVL